jgi:hypothetical protein
MIQEIMFSHLQKVFIQLSSTYSDEWFGGDALYGRIALDAIGYFPATKKLMVGLRYGNNYTLGDVPFYARPIIQLRGAPLMKYQDRNTMVFETEVSLDIAKRWSLVGFAGMGNAYSSIPEFDIGKSVRTMGSGFRYMIARKLGTKMGMDFAASQDDYAIYIIFGSSWLR